MNRHLFQLIVIALLLSGVLPSISYCQPPPLPCGAAPQCEPKRQPEDPLNALNLTWQCLQNPPCIVQPGCPDDYCMRLFLTNDVCIPYYTDNNNITYWAHFDIAKIEISCDFPQNTPMMPCKGAEYFLDAPMDRSPWLLGNETWLSTPASGQPCPEVIPTNPPTEYVVTFQPEEEGDFLAFGNQVMLRWCGCCKFDIKITTSPCEGEPVYTYSQHVNACVQGTESCENNPWQTPD